MGSPLNATMDRQGAESATVKNHGGGWSWLHGLAMALVVCTFVLVALGGTVTSRGAGLAVPDWPTTFGQNMFLYPPSQWRGGVLWEHTHRLMGTVVGMLTIAVALGVWLNKPRRKGLRWLSLAALGLVIVQGIMGGLRVTQISTTLAVVHGIVGQVFLATTVILAALTGSTWQRLKDRRALRGDGPTKTALRHAETARVLPLVFVASLVVQLALGAALRHTGAGLAIPDFPASYGGLLPPMSQQAIDQAVAWRAEQGLWVMAPTAGQVHLHFTHRVWALVVLATGVWAAASVSLASPGEKALQRPALVIMALLMVQIALGAAAVWTGGWRFRPEVATAHQATGAILLATAVLLALRTHGFVPRVTPGSAPSPLSLKEGA